jgi:hypothetical protein
MDCRETQTLLTAFHDGELPAADRARVEEHLRGCPKCGALLADLARADQAAGVPDPGPAYWDRFNARVMDRVEREADGPRVAILRPKHGWMRQQFRYLLPAAAAAALVVVVVRYGGMYPGAPTPAVPPAVSEPAPPDSARQRIVKAEPESRATKTAESTAVARRVPPPPIAKEQFTAVTRDEQDHLADRSLSAGREEASRDRTAAPAAMSVPSPPPMTFRGAPTGSPPATAEDGISSGFQDGRKKMAEASALTAEQQGAGKGESVPGIRMAKDKSAEAPQAVSLGKSRSKAGPASLASAPSRDASPCELARTLAGQGRLRDAEAAQRACLAQDRSAPAQEKGLVFLAELLDRQVRFAEADAVIAEVYRQFPQSRPLDLYRQQRPMVQKQPATVPVTR